MLKYIFIFIIMVVFATTIVNADKTINECFEKYNKNDIYIEEFVNAKLELIMYNFMDVKGTGRMVGYIDKNTCTMTSKVLEDGYRFDINITFIKNSTHMQHDITYGVS